MNENIESVLKQMVDDFNRYSKLITSGHEQSFQWCTGNMNSIGKYMVELAGLMGVELIYILHDIRYRAVEIVKEG